MAACIAKSLDGDGSTLQGNSPLFRRFPDGEDARQGGGFVPAQGAADNRILAGDHTGCKGLAHAAKLVHHPTHHFGVGVHVRSGDILLRPDDGGDRLDESAADPFQLPFGQLLRVARRRPPWPRRTEDRRRRI